MKSIVIRYGGSLLFNPDLTINHKPLSRLKVWYLKNKDRFEKICIVVGGGALSRSVTNRVLEYLSTENDKHDVAMEITQTNAKIIKGYLGGEDVAVPQTLGESFEYILNSDIKTIVTGGLKRGWSTDMDSAMFADLLGTKKIYKLSTIDYIYNKDPREFTDAKPYRSLTWEQYFDLFDIRPSSKHKANNSIPISKECAVFCKNKGISFIVSGGKTFEKENLLSSVMDSGTIVS